MAPRDYSVKDLEKVLEVDGKVKSVEVTRLTPPGENYSSLVLKADFHVEKNGHIRTISTVAKRIPLNQEFMASRALESQKNEITFYKKIVPLLLNFAKEYGLYKEANFYPEFCGARYSLDPSKTEPDEETVLLLKNLIPEAKHFGPPPGAKKNQGPPHKGTWTQIQNIPECAPYISRLQPIIERGMGGPPKNQLKEPWVTITHNDYWGNNILIKQNKGSEPSIILLDHARSTYDSFAKDLIFFLLTSVQNDVQAEYLDDLLRVYYNEFTRLSKRFQVSTILSFEEYMEEVNMIAKQTEVGHSIAFSNIIFGTKNPKFDHLVGEGNIFDNLEEASKNMNQYHKNKIVSIASIAARRNWI